MISMRTLYGTVFAAVCAVFSCNAKVICDIPYDSSIGRFGLGDLFLPDAGNGESAFAGATADKRGTGSWSVPIVLTIHGGGWSSGDRASWEGVARFFAEQLGFAAFNIEYRLASATNRWPIGDKPLARLQRRLREGSAVCAFRRVQEAVLAFARQDMDLRWFGGRTPRTMDGAQSSAGKGCGRNLNLWNSGCRAGLRRTSRPIPLDGGRWDAGM